MYERLVANSELAEPGNPHSCWLWKGVVGTSGYPQVSQHSAGNRKNLTRRAHRAMLEEVLGVTFPHDEAGHLCHVRLCIHPDHLEPQTGAFNLAERRGYGVRRGDERSMIPVLYPREDALQAAADKAWDERGEVAACCPF